MAKYHIKITPDKTELELLQPAGHYSVNSRALLKEGQPWIPIMGEFHYSRYHRDEWEQELWKMKAGGIEVVATYVIWIHHEEVKGEWEFSGQKDLRHFVALCQKVGLKFFLRVGPFAHGEVRNGGLPDWLVGEVSDVRSNDAAYQTYVHLFFQQIYQQVTGYFDHEGGPIIGIQVENEYGHVGGDNGPEGVAHMRWLLQTLKELGFQVPYYTATGWGGAIWVDEMLPVFGGYVEAPWEQTVAPLALSENFLILPQRDDGTIASDHQQEASSALQEVEKYPYLTAELGGGLQVTHHRRPLIEGRDIEAQAFSMFASGANLLGYYMYHGGTNPVGKLTTLQESKATGYLNDLPVSSYDFQAPLGEYGLFHPSYRKLRRLHQFIKSFEQELAAGVTYFPEMLVTDPRSTDLRISARHNHRLGGGFVFVSNYQRKGVRADQQNVAIYLTIEEQEIQLPPVALAAGEIKIFPYQLPIGETVIVSSNAELVYQVGQTLIFAHDEPSQAEITFDGPLPEYLVLTNEEIENGLLVGEELLVTPQMLWQEAEHLVLLAGETAEVTCYPSGAKRRFAEDLTPSATVSARTLSPAQPDVYQLAVSYQAEADLHYLNLHFDADRAELWLGEQMVADHFLIDGQWQVLLERFERPAELELRLFAPTEPVYYDAPVAPEKMTLYSTTLKTLKRLEWER